MVGVNWIRWDQGQLVVRGHIVVQWVSKSRDISVVSLSANCLELWSLPVSPAGEPAGSKVLQKVKKNQCRFYVDHNPEYKPVNRVRQWELKNQQVTVQLYCMLQAAN